MTKVALILLAVDYVAGFMLYACAFKKGYHTVTPNKLYWKLLICLIWPYLSGRMLLQKLMNK